MTTLTFLRYADYHEENRRTLRKVFGLQILIAAVGEGRKFEFFEAIISLGAMVGLFAVVCCWYLWLIYTYVCMHILWFLFAAYFTQSVKKLYFMLGFLTLWLSLWYDVSTQLPALPGNEKLYSRPQIRRWLCFSSQPENLFFIWSTVWNDRKVCARGGIECKQYRLCFEFYSMSKWIFKYRHQSSLTTRGKYNRKMRWLKLFLSTSLQKFEINLCVEPNNM